MANEGEWRPVLEFLSEAIARQTGIRDYIAGEKGHSGVPGRLSELDRLLRIPLGGGAGPGHVGDSRLARHADISLEPLMARYPHLRVGYLIELKYLPRGEPANAARVTAAAGEATAQLQRYLADERLARQFPAVRFTGLVVVFHGWEMVFSDSVAAVA